jgi:Protein of unknown function (DUF2950)
MRKTNSHSASVSRILPAGACDAGETEEKRYPTAEGQMLQGRDRARTTFKMILAKAVGLPALLLLCLSVLHGGGAMHAQTAVPARAPHKALAKRPAKTEAPAVIQATYSTPEEAMQALAQAAKAKDHETLEKIFGPDSEKLESGDRVADNNDLENFASAIEESIQLQNAADGKYIVAVGKDNWPTPIPIVKRESRWVFDTKAGLEEILNRRIGENELSAIATCRAYVIAQWEYFTAGHWDRDAIAAYAQKIISSPGHHDGLYWEVAEGEDPSPLGQLMAAARSEGYKPGQRSNRTEGVKLERHPYHGYYFKILTAQGASAPGGKYSYITNGNMIGGYALVAYPDKWGSSGVMTLIANQQGRVYEKNLGADTANVASAMTEYNPDTTWKLVEP